MDMIIDVWQRYPDESVYGLLALLGFFILLLIVLVFLRKTAQKRLLGRVLKALGNDYLSNVILPDGLDGFIQIDYCVRAKNCLLLLNIRDIPGLLFGGDSVDQWTQMYNQQSYKFENPLYYSQLCAQAVREIVPDVPVKGRVVFTDAGSFPKGKPDDVSLLSDLLADTQACASGGGGPSEDVMLDAWKNFKQALRPGPEASWRLVHQ